MRIGIDVMGGDNAPDAILAGSLAAVGQLSPQDCLVLIGDERIIRESLREAGLENDSRLEVEGTTEVITMDDPPVTAIRNKPDSSIVRMGELAGKRAGARRCDVVISAGNTGACVAAAQMSMRRLPGVHRPGIAVTVPTFYGPIVLCDVGANPEPRPTHLHQYGHMASIFAREVVGIKEPRVALLNIGGEEAKGSTLVKETNVLMKADPSLNYVGYVEGRDLFDGKTDIVVTEGFTGNVVLKLAEGLSSGLFKTIAHEIFEIDPQLAMKFEPVVKSIYKKHDYHEYGGAPLLGANGICIICHGSSEARTITAAIRNAISLAKHNVNAAITEALGRFNPVEEGAA
ncbi:MAG: phosphate acyltransferase PlsX [Phycisphaeraceae bacterium]|nr:phosphate acyltransferase PlsX [Phycisphaeraceae bacterium]